MNKIFSNLNQTGNLVNDLFGQDVRILEDGAAFFRTLMIEDQIDITGSKLINVGTPTDANDAANKSYVDTVAAGLGPIDGSRLIDNTVGLSKLSVIPANTIIANNTGVSSTPIALGVSNIKSMLNLTGTNSGDQEIKLQGDVSGIGYGTFSTTINSNAVTLGKMAQLPPNTIIGNNTGSNFTPAALSVSDVKTMLSLSNSNSGDQTIVLSGAISGTGTGAISTTLEDNSVTTAKIANNNVTLGKIATIGASTILGNKEPSSNSPVALSISQVKTMLDLSNINTGDQMIVLSGAVAGTGTGAISTTLSDGAVTNTKAVAGTGTGAISTTLSDGAVTNTKLGTKAVSLDKIANIGANTILGNNIAGNQSPAALSVSDVKTMLNLTGINSGDQTIILNGAISGSGSSTITTTLADNSVGLGKLGTITPLSIIGNNTGVSATPDALSVAEVKAMLDLSGTNSGDQNITLSGDILGSGTTGIATVIDNGKVTLAKMAALAGNSFIGNNIATPATPKALSISDTRTLLSINNVENTALSTWAGSNNITTVGTINTLRLNNIISSGILTITPNSGASPVEIWGPLDMKTNTISNIGTINCGAITSDSITAKTTSGNLTLNGNSTANGVITNNYFMRINSTVASSDSYIGIDGPTISNGRYIACYQNGSFKCSFGLSGTSYFFISDSVAGIELLRVNMGGGNCIRFPSYTTNGTLSVTGGIGTISSSSDRRLKQDEEELIPADSLQKIMSLKPKKFKWISTPNIEEIGFIAQDVETVIPAAIDGKKYEYEFIRDGGGSGVEGTIRLDENGLPVMDESRPRYRGLNQCAILSTLVSAFQELAKKNNLLEARIAVLESYDYIEP